MKAKFRVLGATLAALLLAQCLTGCAGGGDKNVQSQGGDAGTATTDKAADKGGDKGAASGDAFTVTVTLNGNADTRTSQVEDAYEALLGEKMGRPVDIQFTLIPGSEYDEKAKLLVASNDITDYFELPFMYDYSKAAKDGMFLDLKPYQDKMPNYFGLVNQITNGMETITNTDGKIYAIRGIGLPRFPADKGVLSSNCTTYRYDIFEKNGIAIPSTIDEMYDAAKKLKAIYPDVYPINTRWKDLRSLFNANHVVPETYWNGEKYVMGMFEEGYKEAIQFANKLYAEGLLDPEYIIDTDDTLKSKELNDKTFIVMADWFTTPGEFTRLSNEEKIFAATYFPDNPKYGTAWQPIQKVNEVSYNAFLTGVANANVKDPEAFTKFIDLQYDPEVIELMTWGLEGTTYTKDTEGNKAFVDEIMTAPDPWVAADKWGMRASRNMRPGLGLCDDSTAYIALAPNDYLYYDGALHEEPWEKSPWILSLPYPTSDYIPPNFNEPTLTFTDAENQENSKIWTAVKTYRDEMQSKFVKGEESFDNWDAFIAEIKKIGDIDKLLANYNAAADRFFGK